LAEEQGVRRLVADVAGYSRRTRVNEEETISDLRASRREMADPKVKNHRQRIVKTIGERLLLAFASAVDAVPIAIG
jgi:adenylate cyclase